MPPPLQLRSALSTLPLASSPYLPSTASPSRPRFMISTSNSTASSSTRRRAASTTTTFPPSPSSSSSISSPDHPSVQSITRSQQQQQQLLDIKSAADPRIISLPSTPSSTTTLPWNQYFQLRKTRRYYNLAASVCTSFATTAAGISILSQQDLEALEGTVPGLDPFLLLGLATAGSGAVGWLLGPFVGNAVFGLLHRKLGAQIAAVRLSTLSLFLPCSIFFSFLGVRGGVGF